MGIDPGRLPYKPLIEEAHRREREAEARAELHAQLHPDGEEHRVGGFRRALRRLRDALSRRG